MIIKTDLLRSNQILNQVENLVYNARATLPIERTSKDTQMLCMALIASMRSTCVRRAVGAVIVDHLGRILSIGYNGVPMGTPHCYPPEEGSRCTAQFAKPGKSGDSCFSIHAEQNALLQCSDLKAASTVYVTDSPCLACTKMLLNTFIHRVVFIRDYPSEEAKELWLSRGRLWQHYGEVRNEQ